MKAVSVCLGSSGRTCAVTAMSVTPTDFVSLAPEAPERASSAFAIPATDRKPAIIDAASSLAYTMILDLTNLNFIDPPPRQFSSHHNRKPGQGFIRRFPKCRFKRE